MSKLRVVVCGWRGMLMVAMAVAMAASAVFGQFSIPKVKVPRVGKSTPAEKAPQGPTPTVTSIAPGSVPPGWEGDVVLAGTHFTKTMKLRLDCGYQVKPRDFKVESAERAVFRLKVPSGTEEKVCAMALEVPPGGSFAEIAPTPEGTFQIVQVTGATFAVSESSGLAKAFQACFLVEGNVPPMELVMKLSQSMQAGSQDECKLLVSSDSVKYASKGTTVFDQPASAVKTVEPVLMMGNPIGAFRIVLSSGKIYNFFATGNQSDDDPMHEQIKRRLKK